MQRLGHIHVDDPDDGRVYEVYEEDTEESRRLDEWLARSNRG